jgi:hypothetical protein
VCTNGRLGDAVQLFDQMCKRSMTDGSVSPRLIASFLETERSWSRFFLCFLIRSLAICATAAAFMWWCNFAYILMWFFFLLHAVAKKPRQKLLSCAHFGKSSPWTRVISLQDYTAGGISGVHWVLLQNRVLEVITDHLCATPLLVLSGDY